MAEVRSARSLSEALTMIRISKLVAVSVRVSENGVALFTVSKREAEVRLTGLRRGRDDAFLPAVYLRDQLCVIGLGTEGAQP